MLIFIKIQVWQIFRKDLGINNNNNNKIYNNETLHNIIFNNYHNYIIFRFLVEMFFRFRKIHDNYTDICWNIKAFENDLGFLENANLSIAYKRKSLKFNKLVEVL